MNKQQKQVLQSQLNNEEQTIKELKQVYQQALKDVDEKIRLLSARADMNPDNLQSIIYQKNYQEALKGQLEGVLENLHSNSYATISDYLTRCYQDGYIGVMYDLQGQGIPLIMPIDQEAVTKAIQIDSKISKGLYSRLGEDTNYLKKAIRAEISRGIANGSTWNDMAAKLSKHMENTPFNKVYNNSIRIARTEGHRVQTQSALDAQHKAKEKGADIVKQWDASLDGRTRPTHRQLDGQIREIDEPFEVAGMKADAPGMFGNPAEDCNCRCALLQRAKWALDEAELETLKQRAEYFELDKSEDFEDFKGKYLKISEDDIKGADSGSVRSNAQKMNESIEGANENATNAIVEQYNHRVDDLGVNYVPYNELDDSTRNRISADFTGMDSRLANSTAEQFAKLSSEYESICQGIKVGRLEISSAPAETSVAMNVSNATMTFNKTIVKDYDKFMERMDKAVIRGQFPNIPASQYEKYVVTHEFAHTLMDIESPMKNLVNAETKHIKEARKEIKALRSEYMENIIKLSAEYKDAELNAITTFDEKYWEKAQNLSEKLKAIQISKYAELNTDEFMAEAFADAKLSENPSPYSVKVLEVINKYFKKK